MRKWIALIAVAMLLCMAGMAFAAEAETIVLSFAGDCTLGSMKQYQSAAGEFVTLIGEKGFDHPFSGVKHIFEADDLTLVNLEGTFTNSNKAEDKAFAFRAPPEYAEILPLGSVEAVNIANNHVRDFLAVGREDTMAALEAWGVQYSGDGILAVVEAKGVKIGMTGYSYPHRKTLSEKLEPDIQALREMGCDIIIFSMHSGTEEQYKVGGEQRMLARGAIEMGADIVIGHHPHVIQGVEVYKGKPIFYSLGNFSFGGNGNPKDWDTMIGQVVLEKDADGVQLAEMRIIPCVISDPELRRCDFRPVVADAERAESIMTKIKRYSLDMEPYEAIFETGTLSLRDLGITEE